MKNKLTKYWEMKNELNFFPPPTPQPPSKHGRTAGVPLIPQFPGRALSLSTDEQNSDVVVA